MKIQSLYITQDDQIQMSWQNKLMQDEGLPRVGEEIKEYIHIKTVHTLFTVIKTSNLIMGRRVQRW